MFDVRKYHAELNLGADERYAASLVGVREILDRTAGSDGVWSKFFNYNAAWILHLADLERRLDDDCFTTATAAELQRENNSLFEELLPENYHNCYANPAYGVELFGDRYGQLAANLRLELRQQISDIYLHCHSGPADQNETFCQLYAMFDGETPPDHDTMRLKITEHRRRDLTAFHLKGRREAIDPAFRHFTDIALNATSDDPRYLYRYGVRITDNELRTARFFAEYPREKVERLAAGAADAYLRGFSNWGKSLEGRDCVTIIAPAGFERMIQSLCGAFEARGLKPLLTSPESTPANRQYGYDHRFDYALYLTEETLELSRAGFETALEQCRNLADSHTGRFFMDRFGQEPFAPVDKPENLKADQEITALDRRLRMEMMEIHNRYLPGDKTSFGIIAFPSPEIRGDFEAIFEETLQVNMLDNDLYEGIQHKMIQVLDGADTVRVKGRAGNRTDLRVKMQTLDDPAKHTNFCNCTADVNIPVGEVFTSPQLSGTEGVLHIEEAFLGGLKYTNLELTFTDGYVTGYSCGNFPDQEANLKYIRENLLFPHDTLPIGEFAIGSNTLAYAMAKRHGIMDLLPVLIIEKMGPHFAIGDTCFMWEEDHALFNNIDGKEITARDNERSIKRKDDPAAAYTNIHTDITLPYSSLDSISAVAPDGEEVYLIKGGRFVLPGTEQLNGPIDDVDGEG